MNPYSHIVIASKLEALIHPVNIQDYYWGAIVPDIRYLARLPRQKTHLPPEKIAGYLSQYPHLKSFLQGYMVHCLADTIELERVFFQHFPFSILKNNLSRHRVTIILELYYFENEKVNRKLSGAHNEVLSDLGISETQSTQLAQSISQYSMSSSYESRITGMSRLLGLEDDPRIDKYLIAAKQFQKNWFLRNGLFYGIRTGKISQQIVSMAASLYRQYGI